MALHRAALNSHGGRTATFDHSAQSLHSLVVFSGRVIPWVIFAPFSPCRCLPSLGLLEVNSVFSLVPVRELPFQGPVICLSLVGAHGALSAPGVNFLKVYPTNARLKSVTGMSVFSPFRFFFLFAITMPTLPCHFFFLVRPFH